VTETPASYFEDLWDGSADPWDHAARWYETRKYDLSVAALPAPRYRIAVEPACGVGLLTTRLARRADRVLASDRFARPVAETTGRCAALDNVVVSRRDLRDLPPDEPFDLAVLSEVLYYFDALVVADTVRRWYGACAPGGHVLLVHHRPAVEDHVLTGDDVHRIARDLLGEPIVALQDPLFRLDVFETTAVGG
jgi:SAM-dependent methyltransferase